MKLTIFILRLLMLLQ